ncbi:MAG: hypothetical protein HZB13_11585 [Acidobacteria bacterium]|nr:hypothetical protein [Acidobacteriota bacterium]
MRHGCWMAFAVAVVLAAAAQGQTRLTDVSGTIDFPAPGGPEEAPRTYIGAGRLDQAGTVTLQMDISQFTAAPRGTVGLGSGAGRVTVTMALNRQDRVVFQFESAELTPLRYNGAATVTGGAGAYRDAQGGGTVGLSQDPGTENWTMIANLEVAAGGKTQTVALKNSNLQVLGAKFKNQNQLTGTGTLAPFGNVTVKLMRMRDSSDLQQYSATWTLNEKDSFNTLSSFVGAKAPATVGANLSGAGGAFASATGNLTLGVTETAGGGYQWTVTGRILQPATPPKNAPVITSVTMVGHPDRVGTNAWLLIRGTNLVPATTPAAGVTWAESPEMAAGKMPAKLGEVTVNLNFRPVYIWAYCSAGTNAGCATDQIEVLTTLDAFAATLPLTVTNGSLTSLPYFVTKEGLAPSLALFSDRGDVVATRADGSLVGPKELCPSGCTTPAKPGETVRLWGTGFGLPAEPLTEGSAKQAGTFTGSGQCFLGEAVIRAVPALVSAGVYAIELRIPPSMPAGDQALACRYQTAVTPLGNMLAVAP